MNLNQICMKKSIFILALLFAFAQTYANTNSLEGQHSLVETEVKTSDDPLDSYQCSVTASGTATTSEGEIINLTITVVGPCDSSLAGIMRAAIAKARGIIAEM